MRSQLFKKMLINNFQFSVFKIQLVFLFLLIIGCHSPQSNVCQESQNTFNIDSLWVSTDNAELDSLLQLAAIAHRDTHLAKIYADIGEIYENEDSEKAKEYYLKLKNISEQLNWNEGWYLYAVSFANLLNRERLQDSAIMILQQAYELAIHENNELWAVNIIFSKGNVYFRDEWYQTALTYYMEALPIYENMNNDNKLQQLYYMISQLYTCINAADKAIEYGEKSVALNDKNSYALCALAIAYSNVHQYEKANKYYKDALRIASLDDNLYLMGVIYFHLANDAMFVFDLRKAEKYAHKSMEISKKIDFSSRCIDFILLSKIEQLKGNYDKSEAHVREALQIAKEFEVLEEQKLCYTILAELAVAQHKYRDNIQYWDEMDLIEKAMAHQTSLRAAEEMNAKYETTKKEFAIDQQRRVIAVQNMQSLLLGAGILVCLVVLFLLWYTLRLRTHRNRELAEINKTKDKLFNIISHDLKNPALAQRNALQLLVDNAHTWDANQLEKYHRELLKAAEGEIELLFNLLNWSQFQTGRMVFIPKNFFFSDFLPELSLIRKMADNKNITFNVKIPANALVTADSQILSIVLRNLLTNAIKFTNSGGTITLEISPQSCDSKAGQNIPMRYTITVTDTGIGMNENHLRNLFNVDDTHSHVGTADERGSGLGLIVCKELIEKHGSQLFAESEVGKGSRFWFTV